MDEFDYEELMQEGLAEEALSYTEALHPVEREAESPYVVLDRHIDEMQAVLEDIEVRLTILEAHMRDQQEKA